MKSKMNEDTVLYHLPIGKTGKIKKIEVDGVMRRRLMDLGFVPGTLITAIRKSPVGDPIAYEVMGTIYGLRKEESTRIIIEQLGRKE